MHSNKYQSSLVNFCCIFSIPGNCDYELWRILKTHNESLGISYRRLLVTVKDVANDNSLQPVIDGLSMPHLVVRDEYLDPLRADVGSYCLWCGNGNASVLELVRSRLQSFNDDIYQTTLAPLHDILKVGLGQYEATTWVLHELNQSVVDELADLSTLLNDVHPQINGVFDSATDAVNMVNDVIGYIKDMTSFSSRLHCQTRLPRLLVEYNRKHQSSMDVLANFASILGNASDDVHNKISKYTKESISLTEVSSTIHLKELSQYVQENKLKIDTSLNSRVVTMNAIKGEINQIYYIAMTQLNTSYIAKNSKFWKQFGITQPKLRIPTLRTIDGIDLPLADFGMIPEDELLLFWQTFRRNTDAIFPRLQRQKDDLDSAIAQARLYFNSFTVGNEIGETFSK